MKIKLLLLSVFFTIFNAVSGDAQEIDVALDLTRKNQISVTEPTPGTYDILTTGGDPWIISKSVLEDYNPDDVYVISFDYDAPEGLDNLEIRYKDDANTFNGIRKIDAGALPASTGLSSHKTFIKLQAVEWDHAYVVFRFDFGISSGQQIKVKNLQLRAPTASEVVEIDLNVNAKNQMEISENTDGSYSILTTGGDPWVKSIPLTQTYNHEEVYVMTFQYKGVNESGAFGIDDVQMFYGAPFAGLRSVTLGQQPAATNWKTVSVNLKFKGAEWNQAYDQFRFDFGRRADLNIEVRNIALREPTPAEIAQTTPVTDIAITLNLNSQAQMEAVENTDGSYTITTTGNDPRITSDIIDEFYDYKETFYISFDYIADDGLDNLTIFYGPPSPTRRVDAGDLEPSPTYKSMAINMKRTDTWNSMFTQFRFDFGVSPGQTITVKNIRLRNPTPEEIENDPIIKNQVSNAFLQNYLSADFASQVTNVKVDETDVFIDTEIPNNSGNLFLCELKMYDAIFEPENITFSVPLTSEENFQSKIERFIDIEGSSYDRIYSRWVIAEKSGETFTYVSNARFADDVYAAAKQYLPEEKPSSVKGIGASAGPAVSADLLDLGVKNTRTGIVYAALLSLVPTSLSYEFNGKTYYFNPGYVQRLDDRYKNSSDNGFTTTVVLLIPSDHPDSAKKAILTHPDADPDAFYSIANVTNLIGVNHYAAMTSFLASRYSRPDRLYGRVTNWIIHNEADAASEWTNAGDKPMEVYTELYDRSMRTAYYSIRQHNPAAKVFISLTQFWNAAFDYPPKQMLEVLNQLSDKGGDYEWGIAHHPYPQKGSETWNDTQVTLDLNTSPKITPKNIELMDTWMRSKENLYKGLKVRSLMFTEQGINAGSDYDEETFERQAAGVAYMWKKFSRLPSTEAIHYHRLVDNASVFPVYFGLWTRDENSNMPEKRGIKKKSWYTWQSAETESEEEEFAFALPIIGVDSWEQTFNPLVGEVDIKRVDFSLTNDGTVVNDVDIYFNGEMHRSENEGEAIFFNVASLSDGREIRYVQNDTLIWPEISITVQENKQVSQDLAPVADLTGRGISPTEIEIRWTDILNFEDGFVIERKRSEDSDFDILAELPADATEYLDSDLTPGDYYNYRLRAFNENVQTLYSEVIRILAPNITVMYKDGDKDKPDSNKIRPHIILKNESTTEVGLSNVTVRYWFTAENYSPMVFKVDEAGLLGENNVLGKFVALAEPKEGADHYLEISFGETTSLAALGDSGEIKTKIEKSSPSPFDEGDDYSYANNSKYKQTFRITVYSDGELIWGEEPGYGVSTSEAETVPSSLIAVYPNPANGHTNIKWSTNIEQASDFVLYDYYGVSYSAIVNEKVSDVLSLQLPNLRQGLYILEGTVNGEKVTHRLLIE